MKPGYDDLYPPPKSSDGWPNRDQSPPPPPASGFRIPLPAADLIGSPVCYDVDGKSPVYVGSAIFESSVHPCKIAFSVYPPCRVAYGSAEVWHYGKYELLPITSGMEWVPTKNGEIPHGRRPVEGGYESDGLKLYHALGKIDDVDVPGKAGEHLVSESPMSTVRLCVSPLLVAYAIGISIGRCEHTSWRPCARHM